MFDTRFSPLNGSAQYLCSLDMERDQRDPLGPLNNQPSDPMDDRYRVTFSN